MCAGSGELSLQTQQLDKNLQIRCLENKQSNPKVISSQRPSTHSHSAITAWFSSCVGACECYISARLLMAGFSYSYLNPDVAEIIVVRHGETAWNADGRIQGHLDVELNDVGRQQAVAVATRLSKEPKISAVYSSDLKRAFDTAQVIATHCGGLQVIKDPGLRERHLGELQGLVLREAAKTCPEAYKALMSRNSDQEIPGGGESVNQLYQRCTSSLQRIGKEHKGERVVVVTHGGVIRTLYKRACPNGRAGGKVLNTSINVFHIYNGDKWRLKIWGDVSHLNQSGFRQSGFGGDRTSG